MKLRQKVIVLAVAPLLLALCAIALFVRHQAVTLAEQQRATIEQAYLASKEAELHHYIDLALRSISHLYDSGRTDAAAKEEAKRILASLSYGDDGYFFVYDMEGRNLMHPRQPELVGQNLWELRDANGVPTIQRLIAKAKEGGGLQRYNWAKPSTHQQAPKLGYVVPLKNWNWMLGTGIYLDDVDAALARVAQQQAHNIDSTMAWIAFTAIMAAAAIAVGGLVVNISELRVADAKLKVLAQRVVESQEQERARLSRDLHDGISQWLVSIKLQIEAAIIRLGGSAEQQQQAKAGFERTAEQLNGVLAEVRRISHDLRPPILDDLGLAAALDHLAREATEAGGVAVSFDAQGGVSDGLSPVAKTVLFRIAQEALANVERHAHATRADVTLARADHELTLTIRDDGHGFDPAGVASHPKRGIGLRNMQERMATIGGRLSITSSETGTTVAASVEVA
ncbi:MAG TPA: cache domain-containing protein [Telluria sp.]|nr:cache domain-containing protein [Telluria sp.]